MEAPINEVPQFAQFVQWGFYVLATFMFKSLLSRLDHLSENLNDLKDEIVDLNTRMVEVVEKSSWHERTLEKHESRIERLENKGGKND